MDIYGNTIQVANMRVLLFVVRVVEGDVKVGKISMMSIAILESSNVF